MLDPVGLIAPELADGLMLATAAGQSASPPVTANSIRSVPSVTISALPLQPKLPGQPLPQVSQVRPAAGLPQLTAVLGPGSQGDAVHWVQQWLYQGQYYRGNLDGIYGPLTTTAVRQFQQGERLRVDGLVGPQTWNRLQRVATRQPVPGNTALGRVGTPDTAQVGPQLTPTLPLIQFHPIAIAPVADQPHRVWVTVLTLVALGSGTFGLQQTSRLALQKQPHAIKPRQTGSMAHLHPAKSTDSMPSQTIHRPEPIYPTRRFPSPPSRPLPPTNRNQASPQPAVDSPALPDSDPISPPRTNATVRPDAVNWCDSRVLPSLPWAGGNGPTYLEDFLYDLSDADSLGRLLQQMGVSPSTATKYLSQLRDGALVRQLGTFPAKSPHSGFPYSYTLLDDIGGCFRMQNNELWATEAALEWLRDDVPYQLTVRRFDPQGRAIDKTFAIILNHYLLNQDQGPGGSH